MDGAKKKVGVLLRVSTEMQARVENNESDIPAQRVECERFIKKHPDWFFEKEYIEIGVSGYKNHMADRDKINEIISDIGAKRIDILLTFMFDRLARTEEEAPAVVRELVSMGAEVWSVREGQMKYENHIDSLMSFITFWQAAGESKKISERVSAAMRLMAEEGRYTGGKAPYGYTAVETGKLTKKKLPERKLEVNAEEAEIARLIFNLAVTRGYGCRRIAARLNQEGYKTRQGKQWSGSTISNMINNPIYKGVKAYNRTTAKKGRGAQKSQRRTSPDQWVFSRADPGLAIVSEDIWDSAQSIKAKKLDEQQSRRDENEKGSKRSWASLLFTGYIYCGCCGSSMITGYATYKWETAGGEKKKGNRPVYKCCGKSSGKTGCGAKASYAREAVEEPVLEEIYGYLGRVGGIDVKGEIARLQKEGLELGKKKIRSLRGELTGSQKRLKAFEEEVYRTITGESPYSKEKLIELISKEEASIDEIKTKLARSEEELERKKHGRAELPEPDPIWSEELERADPDAKKVLLSKIIDRVYVYPGKVEARLRISGGEWVNGII